MSHFTVLVITKDQDYDTPLIPFNEQGDDDDPFMDRLVEEVDLARARESLRKQHEYVGDDPNQLRYKAAAPALDADDLTVARWWDGDHVQMIDGKVAYIRHHNADIYGPGHGLIKGAKWDWYALGGRWLGSLKLKPGGATDVAVPTGQHWTGAEAVHEGGVNQAPKGAVDFDVMRQVRADEAGAKWDAYEAIVAEHGPLPDDTWTNYEDKSSPEFEEAKAAYWNHPTIKALQKAEVIGHFGFPSEEFGRGMTRELYVQDARDGAVPGFALLTVDGEWHEPGAMGWFGMSTDSPESRRRYWRKVNEIIDATPDDHWLSVVDCHI